MTVTPRLIIDIGMAEGNDTAFYLAKGFDVVGVEADPAMQMELRRRFAAPIADGRLILLHRAASALSGEMVSFSPNDSDEAPAYPVASIDWTGLRAVAGTPYYLKIDTAGGEPAFLGSMLGNPPLPPYISSEIRNFAPIELFRAMGYQRFRLINQQMFHGIVMPDPPLEGVFVPRPSPDNWSGPFGRETPGTRWFTYAEIRDIHATIHQLWLHGTLITGWMDCHAKLAED